MKKINWIKVFYNSFKNGWIDPEWKCKATWGWHFKRFIPFTKYPSSNLLVWALLASYYEPQNHHFVIPTGACMMCKKKFQEYDARQEKEFCRMNSVGGIGGKWI